VRGAVECSTTKNGKYFATEGVPALPTPSWVCPWLKVVIYANNVEKKKILIARPLPSNYYY